VRRSSNDGNSNANPLDDSDDDADNDVNETFSMTNNRRLSLATRDGISNNIVK
jgi:hypothetical protein